MKRLSGGIDIGSESHHIIILDEEDNFLYNQKVNHKLNEFAENIKLFKQIDRRFLDERLAILHPSKSSLDFNLTKSQT